MSDNKDKSLKKLKKRHLWPSLVMFFLFLLVSAMAIALLIEFYSVYVVGAKFTSQYERAMDIATMIERRLDESGDIVSAVEDAAIFGRGVAHIYVTDDQGVRMVSTGDSEPLFDKEISLPLAEDYELYQDSEWLEENGPANITGFAGFHVQQILKRTIEPPPERMRLRHIRDDAWMAEPILQQQFWMYVPDGPDGYRIYVRTMLQIEREEVIYIILLGGAALIVMCIPLLFLLYNTVTMIATQRNATRLLYRDPMTGGNNWLIFQRTAGRMLESVWNARKTYALVDLHMEDYTSYVSFFGSKEGAKLMECMDGFLGARMGKKEAYGHHSRADFGLIFPCSGSDAEACRQDCFLRLRSLLAELAGLQPERKLHFHAGVFIIPPVASEGRRFFTRRRDVDIDQMYSFANTAQTESHAESEQIFFFNRRMLEERGWEQWIEGHMQEALSAGEFHMWLQPKYCPRDSRLMGAEALVRWHSPERGIITPGRFIPLFEENGFITKLDDYMLSCVAKLQARWKVEGRKAVPISVNVSRVNFVHEGLAERISQLVDGYGAPHQLVELEVTESAFFDDKETLINTVKQLRAYGFAVSMDDFGAGYSSLNSLKDIPLDVLKLDGEFFRGDDAMGRGALIVREAVALAKELDMRVVAEGVESREQVDFLADIGCDMIQGYYFAKPMPVEEFEKRMAEDA